MGTSPRYRRLSHKAHGVLQRKKWTEVLRYSLSPRAVAATDGAALP
jgi:hypothetical protein